MLATVVFNLEGPSGSLWVAAAVALVLMLALEREIRGPRAPRCLSLAAVVFLPQPETVWQAWMSLLWTVVVLGYVAWQLVRQVRFAAEPLLRNRAARRLRAARRTAREFRTARASRQDLARA